jgi:hypothetical protein
VASRQISAGASRSYISVGSLVPLINESQSCLTLRPCPEKNDGPADKMANVLAKADRQRLKLGSMMGSRWREPGRRFHLHLFPECSMAWAPQKRFANGWGGRPHERI